MRTPDIDADFKAFDAANPEVFRLFVRFALEAVAAGRKRFGAGSIIERIRWHVAVETKSTDGLKINDHFSSRFARKFIAWYPEHEGLFELRALREERAQVAA